MASIPAIVWKTYAPCSFRARAWAFGRTLLLEFDRILAHAPSRGHFVELGCGTGVLSNLLALGSDGRTVVGSDANPHVIDIARATVGQRSNLRFEVARVEDVVLRPPVDVIVAVDLFHHLSARAQMEAFERIHEALAPGGMFLFKEVDRTPRWKFYANRLHDAVMDPGNPLCVRHRADYEAILQRLGFEVEVILMHRLVYAHVLFVARKRGLRADGGTLQ